VFSLQLSSTIECVTCCDSRVVASFLIIWLKQFAKVKGYWLGTNINIVVVWHARRFFQTACGPMCFRCMLQIICQLPAKLWTYHSFCLSCYMLLNLISIAINLLEAFCMKYQQHVCRIWLHNRICSIKLAMCTGWSPQLNLIIKCTRFVP